MTPPKRHHYVPQFYLGHFTTEIASKRRMLWVYDKDGGAPRSQSPKDTAVEIGYYRINTKSGKSVVVEESLAEIETATAPVVARLLEPAARLTDQDILVLAQFLGSLHVRGPRMLQIATEFLIAHAYHVAQDTAANPEMITRFLREKGAELAADGKEVPTEAELMRILQTAEEQFELRVDNQAALLEALKAAPVIVPILYQMNWCLCRAPSNSFFITSDTPLCVHVKTERNGELFGTGFDRPNVQAIFPISPNAAILIDRLHGQRRLAVSKAFVREANRRMALYAERYIFSSIRTQEVAKLVRWASGTRSVPKLDRHVVMAELVTRKRRRQPANGH